MEQKVHKEAKSQLVIDGHPVDSRAIPIGSGKYIPEDADTDWVAKHCQQARYSLQVVKCRDKDCCSAFTTDWLQVFPDRFIPFPAVYDFCPTGLKALSHQNILRTQENSVLLLFSRD